MDREALPEEARGAKVLTCDQQVCSPFDLLSLYQCFEGCATGLHLHFVRTGRRRAVCTTTVVALDSLPAGINRVGTTARWPTWVLPAADEHAGLSGI